MNKAFIASMDASLSHLVFTRHMQDTVLRKVRLMRLQEAQARPPRRHYLLPALAAACLLLLTVQLGTSHPDLLEGPMDPTLVGKPAAFEPIVPASPQPTLYVSPAPTAGPTASPTEAPTPTPTATPTATPSPTPTATPTATPSPTPTATPTAAPSPTPTATPTATPSPTPTATPTPTPVPTATPCPSEPPQSDALVVCSFEASSLDGFQSGGTTLRIYPSCSYLTASFTWKAGLPPGTVLRIVGADGTEGHFGEAVLSAESVSRFSAVICTELTLCNTLTLQAVAPGGIVQFTVNCSCTDWDAPVAAPASTSRPSDSQPSNNRPSVTADPSTYKLNTVKPTSPLDWISDGAGLYTPPPAGFQAPNIPSFGDSNGWGW